MLANQEITHFDIYRFFSLFLSGQPAKTEQNPSKNSSSNLQPARLGDHHRLVQVICSAFISTIYTKPTRASPTIQLAPG